MDKKRELLRHMLSTVAYRTSRALEGSHEEFGGFDGAGRKPVEILAHMGDLMEWALSAAVGNPQWQVAVPLAWGEEQRRFFAVLRALDAFLASRKPLHTATERLLQGPIADALTHVGQLAMLRRMAGSPTRGENFVVAAIEVGHVDAEQPEPVRPFQ
jgi:hypothetical protein